MNSSQGFPRLALFLCGCAAFLNLYTTQGIFDELAASFHISAHQSNWSITATTLAVAIAAPMLFASVTPLSTIFPVVTCVI